MQVLSFLDPAIPKGAVQPREFIAFQCKSLWVKYPLVKGGTTSPCSSQVTSSLFCCPFPVRRNYCLPGPGERAPKNLRLHNDTLKPLWVFIVSRDERASRGKPVCCYNTVPARVTSHRLCTATLFTLPCAVTTVAPSPGVYVCGNLISWPSSIESQQIPPYLALPPASSGPHLWAVSPGFGWLR